VKKVLLAILSILVLSGLVFAGCDEETAQTTAQAPTSAVTTTEPAAGTPLYGGTLRVIAGSGPQVLGFFPKMWVGDELAMLPAVERILDYDANHDLVPWLAESWDVSADGKSITIKLREGIKFTDGSDFNAEVVAWNYQMGRDAGRLQGSKRLLSIEVVDDYTVRLNATEYNALVGRFWGWYPMFSKEAYEKNGEEWCVSHCVATGPFMVGEYKRDDYLEFVKNPNYWQAGKPYLDSIMVKIVPDSTIAAAMMQAGEADLWGASPQFQKELETAGLIRQATSVYGGPVGILPNNMDTDSKFTNLKLREAVEYAIDKSAIAKALGFGYSVPMNSVFPEGAWGYIEKETRPYNPDKARQLIADAGYPNGLTVKLTAAIGSEDTVTALKQMLDAVGMTVEVDIADMGRYYDMAYTSGWPDLLLYGWGVDPPPFVSMHCLFGPEPLSDPKSFYRPQEFVDMAHESLTKRSTEDLKAYTEKMVKYLEDEALVIPLTYTPAAVMVQPWVRTTYTGEWYWYWCRYAANVWLDKH